MQPTADMANEIAEYYDTLKRQIVQQRSMEAFEVLKKEIEMLYEHINDIQRLGEIAFAEYGEKGIEQESDK